MLSLINKSVDADQIIDAMHESAIKYEATKRIEADAQIKADAQIEDNIQIEKKTIIIGRPNKTHKSHFNTAAKHYVERQYVSEIPYYMQYEDLYGVYSGYIKNKLPHGYGLFKYRINITTQTNNTRPTNPRTARFISEVAKPFNGYFRGMFKQGILHGKGKVLYPNGTKITGKFHENIPHGQCLAEYANGDTYVGEFDLSHIHGNGTYRFASGVIYKGIFINYSLTYGTMIFPNGTKYKGFFQNARLVRGKKIFANGLIESGMFSHDQLLYGKRVNIDSPPQYGHFVNNVLVMNDRALISLSKYKEVLQITKKDLMPVYF